MLDTPRIMLLMGTGASYDRGVLRGIARYARHYGPWTFLLSVDQPAMPFMMIDGQLARTVPAKPDRRSRTKSTAQDLRRLGVAGVIGRLLTPQITEALIELELPVVAMDLADEQLADERLMARVSEIRPDSHKAGRLAAEHLLERGFRRFAYCGHPKSPNWSRHREEGFCERLREAGFGCDVFQSPRAHSSIHWHREQPALVTWLQSLQTPVGIMACNDVRGRQVLEACILGKMHVPNDVAVVGVDEDQILSELSNPPLSSVALDGEQGGYRAAELLHRLMLGEVKEQQRLLVEPLWVVPRLSTEVFAVEDREVGAAVKYIRENARRPIQVVDVVEHLDISRRALEIRFQRSLGWSIREEIERVRIGLAKQLLVETDLSLAKIAAATGFSSDDYMAKVFRASTNMTLAQYRRAHRAS